MVYGLWPGDWVEHKLLRKGPQERTGIARVARGVVNDTVVHAVESAARWQGIRFTREARDFFIANRVALAMEETATDDMQTRRKTKTGSLHIWYGDWIGRVWWINGVFIGQNFARGRLDAGLIRKTSERCFNFPFRNLAIQSLTP